MSTPLSPSRRNPDVTRQRWPELLEQFRRSGQTITQFCTAEDISDAVLLCLEAYARRRGRSPATSSV
ncbi:MAG TPA: hypothetical protein VG122_09400 [Gemmata sp.]|jgi:hypothetical protein|nr:hypothetical protein [Gemmata sp.]